MTELFARVKMADYFFFTLCSLSFASQDKLQSMTSSFPQTCSKPAKFPIDLAFLITYVGTCSSRRRGSGLVPALLCQDQVLCLVDKPLRMAGRLSASSSSTNTMQVILESFQSYRLRVFEAAVNTVLRLQSAHFFQGEFLSVQQYSCLCTLYNAYGSGLN